VRGPSSVRRYVHTRHCTVINGLSFPASLLTRVVCRFAQSNGMYTLEGLEAAPALETLNIEINCLESLEVWFIEQHTKCCAEPQPWCMGQHQICAIVPLIPCVA